MDKKTVQVIWFQGREFQRVTWHRPFIGATAVIVVFGGCKHIRPDVMNAKFMGRHEV
jgi:hypothetical protein